MYTGRGTRVAFFPSVLPEDHVHDEAVIAVRKTASSLMIVVRSSRAVDRMRYGDCALRRGRLSRSDTSRARARTRHTYFGVSPFRGIGANSLRGRAL